MTKLIGVLATIVLLPILAYSQCQTRANVNLYLQCKIQERAALRKGLVAIKANGLKDTNQQEAPSIASQTTSLVDQTSASDFVNLAVHLAKLSAGNDKDDTNSISVTTSAYALYAAANDHDPLDPEFYQRNRDWRRVYLTLGRDMPEKETSTTKGTDPHKLRPGTVASAKLLVINHRDISSSANDAAFNDVTQALAGASIQLASLILNIQNSGVADFADRYKVLTATEEQIVNSMIDSATLTAVQQLDKISIEAAQRIRKNKQLSVAYTVNRRDGQGYDEHYGEFIYDHGLHERLNLTANAGYKFLDGKDFARDERKATSAIQFAYRLTEDPNTLQPIMFNVAASGEWAKRAKPIIKVQGKLTIPLGQKTGVGLPISVTYASRRDLIQESHVETRFGFTFDAQKVAAALLQNAGR